MLCAVESDVLARRNQIQIQRVLLRHDAEVVASDVSCPVLLGVSVSSLPEVGASLRRSEVSVR